MASIEDIGPDEGNRWTRRAVDIANGWVMEWVKILHDSSGTFRKDGPVGRWPFRCQLCGREFYGHSPKWLRHLHEKVEKRANTADDTRRKGSAKVNSFPACCGRDDNLVLWYRHDGKRPNKKAVIVAMERKPQE